jgi:hypothetical protein
VVTSVDQQVVAEDRRRRSSPHAQLIEARVSRGSL